MHRGRIACIVIMMTALAAPAPAPSAVSIARGQIESAVALEQAGRYGEAVEELSHAIDSRALSRADAARARFDRALAYDGLGNMGAAVADYSAALRLDPALTPALNNRADALRRAGQLEAAKRDYAAVLKRSGAAREYAYHGLGLIAQQQGATEAARDYFQKALAANPRFAPAADGLAETHPKTASGLRPSQDDDRRVAAGAPPERPVAIPATGTSAPAGGRPVLVQLGAYQNEASAHVAWNKITAGSGDALQGLTPIAVPVDRSGKERLWRLRTAVPNRKAALRLCSALTQRQLDCALVQR